MSPANSNFRAIVALPLQAASRVLGTVTFYFADPGGFTPEKRGLLRIVADQMAATAEKAGLIDEMRRTNAALVEANAELERQYVAVVEARRVKDEFLANVSYELRTPLTAVMGYLSILSEQISGPLTDEQSEELGQARSASGRLLELIDALLEFTALRRGTLEVMLEEFDPRVPLREAMRLAKGLPADCSSLPRSQYSRCRRFDPTAGKSRVSSLVYSPTRSSSPRKVRSARR